MARTSPRPNDAAGPLARLRQPQADVVHLHDQADDAVDDRGDRERDDDEDQGAREQRLVGDLVERDHHDLRREDEVRADRPADELLLVLGSLRADRRLGVVVMRADRLPQLLGALVAEVGAADHQDRGEQPRQQLAEQQRGGQDEEQLVAQRAGGDPLDHRQLALGPEALDVARGDRGVVDDHAGGLHARPARTGGDVVDRGRGRRGRAPRRRRAARRGRRSSPASPARRPARHDRRAGRDRWPHRAQGRSRERPVALERVGGR